MTSQPIDVTPDGSIAFKPKFEPNDLVRVIGIEPGTMIESYLGSEGRVISIAGPVKSTVLYLVELDVGRANADRAGQFGPRFLVKEEHLSPEVTSKMFEAAAEAFRQYGAQLPADGMSGVHAMTAPLARMIYRAMRAARFER